MLGVRAAPAHCRAWKRENRPPGCPTGGRVTRADPRTPHRRPLSGVGVSQWGPPKRPHPGQGLPPPPAPLGFEWREWGSPVTLRGPIGPGGAMTSFAPGGSGGGAVSLRLGSARLRTAPHRSAPGGTAMGRARDPGAQVRGGRAALRLGSARHGSERHGTGVGWPGLGFAIVRGRDGARRHRGGHRARTAPLRGPLGGSGPCGVGFVVGIELRWAGSPAGGVR